MKQIFFIFSLLLAFWASAAQNWCEDLGISKKTPFPFGLEHAEELDQTKIPSEWSFDAAPDNEWIYERDSASVHLYTKSGQIDGAMMVVSCSSETASETSFQRALKQFEKTLGESSFEMGKHLWEIKQNDKSFFLSLQSLSPFQRNGWTLNVHVFQ